jgi:DNA-binding CsgD family transcriptional regulator
MKVYCGLLPIVVLQTGEGGKSPKFSWKGSCLSTELDIIGLIYDAVTDSSLWERVLVAFIQATNGIGGSLSIGNAEFDEIAFVCRHHMSPEEAAEYQKNYASTDGWALRVHEFPEGYAGASHDIWPEAEMVESPAYREFYGPRNWHYGMGGVILRTPHSISLITMLREKEKGPCVEAELALCRTLLPHLRRAALLQGELTALRSQRLAFLSHLDRYPQAFLLIDSDRKILVANTPGREVLDARDGLRVEGGRIRTASPAEDAALADAVRRLANERESRVSRLSVARRSHVSPYLLLLLPVPSRGAAPLGVSQPAVAIVVIDPENSFSPDTSALADLFGLTPAELRVTSLLVQGRSMEQIGVELKVSIETIRTHVRRVFSKTSTNRQGELIALVLRSVPFERL